MHFAVAGCGVISRFHLDAIRSIEDAALCGVYDPVEASARAAAQAYGTRAYPDYDALLADPQVDAVCICTPSHLHAPLALQAVAAGKHVLIEKPVALTLEDCDAVAAAARAAGVQVGENIAHTKNTGSHSFRVENLEIFELFACTSKLNRLACDCSY